MARVTDLEQTAEVLDDLLVLLEYEDFMSQEAQVHVLSLRKLIGDMRQVSRMLLYAEERAAWERIAAQEHAAMLAAEARDYQEQAVMQEQYAAEGRGLAGEYLDWDGEDVVAGVVDRASDPVEWNDPIEGDNPW